MIDLKNQKEKLKYVLDLSWSVFIERLITKKIIINLEASLQLHYSSVINQLGELLIVSDSEKFKIELEHDYLGAKKYIDIQCSYDEIKAAIELKCFRKGSNRAKDFDMYDSLKDIEKLQGFDGYDIKRFICLTDNKVYLDGKHTGHGGIVSIKDGRRIVKGTVISPTWLHMKDKSRNTPLVINSDILCNWIRKDPWYYLVIDL